MLPPRHRELSKAALVPHQDCSTGTLDSFQGMLAVNLSSDSITTADTRTTTSPLTEASVPALSATAFPQQPALEEVAAAVAVEEEEQAAPVVKRGRSAKQGRKPRYAKI